MKMLMFVFLMTSSVYSFAETPSSDSGRFVVKEIEWDQTVANFKNEKNDMREFKKRALAKIDTQTGKIYILNNTVVHSNEGTYENIGFVEIEKSGLPNPSNK